MQEALEEQNKARIEQAKKMDTLIKRMDHTERARRENEAPLLQEAYAQKIKASPAVLHQGYSTVLLLAAVHVRHKDYWPEAQLDLTLQNNLAL